MAKKQGRPTKYTASIHDDLVYKLVMDNKSNDSIADLLGIGARTFYDWLDRYPSFSQSYKKGVESKLDNVEMSLYQRAFGMTYKETTKTVVKGKKGEDIGKAEVREVTKYLPPDVAAMCFILKTQRRDKWAERQEVDVNDGNLVINVSPAVKKKNNEEE
jgi:transposase